MELNKEIMITSYGNSSFSPEKRGEYDFKYYTELLENDLIELGENKGNYKEKFIKKVMLIYYRQTRCASPMIVGPAKFDNRKNQKLWDSRDRALLDFDYWRTKYFKLVNRVRTLSPEEEIDATLEKLDRLEEKKATLKENNIGGYELTRLTTKIREQKKKLEVMKNRIEVKTNFEPIKFNGGMVTLDNDRIIIKHDNKPNKEIIEVIKKNGFRYSPKTVSWVRKHTENARWTVNKILPLIEIKSEA